MNAERIFSNKWVLAIGVLAVLGLTTGISLADHPHHGFSHHGFRGGFSFGFGVPFYSAPYVAAPPYYAPYPPAYYAPPTDYYPPPVVTYGYPRYVYVRPGVVVRVR